MRIQVLSLLVLMSACGVNPPAAPSAETLGRAETAAPSDVRLAGLYAGSCRACHTKVDGGAPLTFDRAAWDPRWRKGEATLLNHTVSGFNGMPAGGQCFACSADDFRALIQFMAGREGE